MSTQVEKPEMVFYELQNLNQFKNEMNENNKFKLRQFNNIERLTKADETLFDLVIVPGLAFDLYCGTNDTSRMVSRLGRGKGYYDVFLSKIPDCYTIGIGFNEQFVPFNSSLIEKNLKVPVDESKDVLLNQFSCELTIKKNI
jgi:5-formyltetrahydrofolate cyclo-ligase